MSRLAELLFQGSSFLTFVVLEMICFYLIINFNSDQRAIYLETVSVYTGSVNEKVTNLTDYVGLRDRVAELQNEVTELRARLPESLYDATTSVDSINDDSLRQRYVYLAAEIINKSPYGPNNTFIINQGEAAGVARGQGVVAGVGLVGIVTAVADQHARVMSLLHRDTRLSAGVKSRHFGTLRWDGQDPRIMTLADMKSYVPVQTGDTIFTTGYSSVFPTDLPIGIVTKKQALAGTGNWELEVTLLNDPLGLHYVYVTKDLFKEDLARLNPKE